jgi:ribosomal protein L29
MLSASEIRQLSDKDLVKEIAKTRDLLFRQKMGVKTGHLKDNHLIKSFKKFTAKLLTVQNERKLSKTSVAESSKEVTKKIEEATAKLGEKKEPTAKKTIKASAEKDVSEKSTTDVKVKKVEKKSLLSKITKKSEA